MPHVFQDDGSGLSGDCCPLPPSHEVHVQAPTQEAPPPVPVSPAPPQEHQAALPLVGGRDGLTYEQAQDEVRLNAQALRVFDVMGDGAWRTLADVAAATGDPEASVSARLRDFRKPRFGALDVSRRRRADGAYEYRVLIPEGSYAE